MDHGATVKEAREYLADRRAPTPQVHAMVVALDELATENARLRELLREARSYLSAGRFRDIIDAALGGEGK